MWVPEVYRPTDPAWAGEFVGAHPFAVLTVVGPDGVPVASHVPIVLPPEAAPGADRLTAVPLLGHLARANPMSDLLATGPQALAVFHGPHGYVSPTAYRTTPAAPTWNYTAVHVTGRVRVLSGEAAVRHVLRVTTEAAERDQSAPWDMAPSRDYHEALLRHVVAFELAVTRVEAVAKLSQDKAPQVRARVRSWLCDDARGVVRGGDRDLAAVMAAADPETVPAPGAAPDPGGERDSSYSG